ncbi:MAG: hypothetical protein A2998_02300 [Candidatus Staskawiczbacteria bacterium RIFCSPLOWO2_01_FULL_37_25b]|uniref:Uncharacterized protein n=1 Tax=Candidatus Staskawiczbacteria bacterium RIFCSPLOWO2_01_FULL_37_25b TaxID=1802213 RepID=A0A1G2IHI7_9BACT|nr:MAG: hypothetical protein A2998_02300 [Candidatus Staskawiczbacteria bacterium RIFCSPLOWO2_01_FULL_37_25b]
MVLNLLFFAKTDTIKGGINGRLTQARPSHGDCGVGQRRGAFLFLKRETLALERNRYVQDKFAPPGTRAGASKALLQARQNSSFLRFLFFGGRRTECQAKSGATSV